MSESFFGSNCPNCGKLVSEKRIKYKQSTGRGHENVYCNRDCYNMYFSEMKEMRKDVFGICEQCGNRCHKSSRLCDECYRMGLSVRFTNDEIIELVRLNPGCGFDYFIDNVWSTSYPKKAQLRYELFNFLTALGEFESFDYVKYLQRPDEMEIVKHDDLQKDGRYKYSTSQRRTTVGNLTKKQRRRAGVGERDSAQVKIKLPPKFNWGRFSTETD